MILQHLRPIFAIERRPLLKGHVVLALALIPVPWFRTGVADLLLIAYVFPWPHTVTYALMFCLALTVLSLPLIPLFLAWSLPGAGRPGLSKHSIGALCLLIAYHPYRYLLEGTLYVAQTQALVAQWHEQFPIIWVFKHLDTPALLCLVIWTVVRCQSARPAEKAWFHWLLFVCAIWAMGAFDDFWVGDSLVSLSH